jgi:hypothetical protein
MDLETTNASIYSTINNINNNKTKLVDYDKNPEQIHNKKIIKFNKKNCSSIGIYIILFIIYLIYQIYNYLCF